MVGRAAAAIVLATSALVMLFPGVAGAHAYNGQYTWRLHSCGDSFNQLACQSHYILAVDSPLYGPLWKVQHSQGCTTPDPPNLDDEWYYNDV